MDSFEREWITNFLHSFPHVTFSFKLNNSTFNPDDADYRESIIFLAILPVVLFVLFLIISLCCTCYQCKKERPQKRVKSCCPAGIIGIIIFVAIAAAAIGLYANEKTDNGVNDFNDAVKDVNKTLTEALKTINKMHGIAANLADRSIPDLEKVLLGMISNLTVKTQIGEFTKDMLDQSTKAKTDIKNLLDSTPDVNLDFISDNTTNGEFIRWTSTVVVLSVILFVLVVSLCGCCKRSRCLLATSISFGFLILFLSWIMNGVYLGGSVTNADLCVDPESFIENVVNERIEKDIIKTYIKCKDDGAAGQYSHDISEALSAVTLANDTLSKIYNVSISLSIINKVKGPIIAVRTQLNYGFGNLTALSNVFQCQRTHDNYLAIKEAVCHTVIFNMSLILAAFLLLSLLLSLTQCILPKMWHLSGKRRGSGYRPVDDTDPFVPRPPPYQDYGAVYGIGSPLGPSNSDAINMTGGPPLDSPPPAYSVRGFGESRHARSHSTTSSEA
ncbi:TTYH [Mytilus edulis]|uniref:Protein tweety homolog n=1 Tax=Mytilus edulis TaxID=6550 RepID=A0A8S3UCS7_MYTED|nr:TTYH [Mytilus edulis]